MPTALITSLGRALGSASARRLLTQDQIPAVVYGHGMTPTPVTVDRKALRVALSGPAGLNTVLDLQVGNDTYPAIIKEVQRDPVKRIVRHVDFLQISLTELITVHVPLHIKGTAKAVLAEGADVLEREFAGLVVVLGARRDLLLRDAAGHVLDHQLLFGEAKIHVGTSSTNWFRPARHCTGARWITPPSQATPVPAALDPPARAAHTYRYIAICR